MSGEDDMFGAPKPEDVSHERVLRCVDREIDMRRRVYPNWVQAKRMSQRVADQEILAMRRARDIIADNDVDKSLIVEMTNAGGCVNCDAGLVHDVGDYGARYGADFCSCAYGVLLKSFAELRDAARDALADFESPTQDGRLRGSTYERMRALLPKEDGP